MLRVTEIYKSIQGESSYVGLPCVLVRLTGCNLRCGWCDTEYAFEGGEKKSLEDVIAEIKKYKCHLVEITGGEPLLQKETKDLIDQLCAMDYQVLVETGGSLPIKDLHPSAVIIMDVKCPGSGESGSLHLDNLNHLKYNDEVKFVISDRFDYDWTLNFLKIYNLSCKILFSPTWGVLNPKELAEWMLKDNLHHVRMQMQLHKVIWGVDAKSV